jgi:hypothetical protein
MHRTKEALKGVYRIIEPIIKQISDSDAYLVGLTKTDV